MGPILTISGEMSGKVREADNKNSNINMSPVIAVLQLFRRYHGGGFMQVKLQRIESAWHSCSVASYYFKISINRGRFDPLGLVHKWGNHNIKGGHVQTDNKFFDDLAKLGQSAVGTLHGVKGEMEAAVRAHLEQMMQGMDLVSREEFEVVRDMAKQARAENLQLAQQVADLQKALAETGKKPATPTSRKKTPSKSDKDTK